MKHHLNQKHLASALALLLGLLLLLHSCRKEHAVPTANVLASYKGSDKNVLKIIEELKKPENKTLLATLNQQGGVDWENYKTMLTSDFMQGLTLRFYQGPDSNYFDAQLNLETKDLRLLSKAQKRVEREQAIAQLMAESKTKGKSTMGYNDYRCKTPLNFEFVITYGNSPLIESRFPYILSRFYFYLTQEMARYSFEYTSGRFIKYSVNGITTPQDYGNEIIIPIKSSFDYALNSINMEFRGFNYNNVFFGYVARIVSEGPTMCTTGDDGGGGGDNAGQQAGGDEEPTSYNWRNKLTDNWIAYLNQEPPHTILDANGDEIPNPESFNCHYYTFHDADPSALIEAQAYNGWPKVFNNVLLQNWQKVTSNIKVGDVVLYFREGINGPNTLSHSGRVVGVDAQGNATLISSKMGVYQIITHHPRDIPVSYGSNQATYTATNAITYPSRIYFRKK